MATRDLTASVVTEITSDSFTPIIFIHTTWTSGDVYFCSRPYDVQWNSQTWLGGGNIISITDIEETAENKVAEFKITLNGIPAGNRALVESNLIRGSAVKVYMGFMDSNNSVISDPYLFEGILDSAVMVGSSESSMITLTIEDEDSDFKRPRLRKYSDVDHQEEFSGDDFFADIANIPNNKIYFGQAPESPTVKSRTSDVTANR